MRHASWVYIEQGHGSGRACLFDFLSEVIYQGKLERHVIALHNGAGVDRRERQINQTPVAQNAFFLPDGVVDEYQGNHASGLVSGKDVMG